MMMNEFQYSEHMVEYEFHHPWSTMVNELHCCPCEVKFLSQEAGYCLGIFVLMQE
jgi:hypothetical protein